MGINISRVLLQPHERSLSPDDPRLLEVSDRAAVERVADQVSQGVSRQVWREIINHSQQENRSPSSVRRDIFIEGVVLALTHMHDAQRFRAKDEWVVGDNKKIAEIIPYNLTPSYFEIWLHQETHKAAEAVVLGQPYPATDDLFDIVGGIQRPDAGTGSESLYQLLYSHSAPLDHDDEFLPDPTDLDDLDERHEVAKQRLAMISENLTPKERDLLSSLERGESRTARAERMGDKAPAIRKQYQRFHEHVADITEAQKRDADRECERCEFRELAALRRMRESKARAQEAQRRGAWEEVHDHEERAWNALHDAYLWRDRADRALADMSTSAQRTWIARRFTREEAWEIRDDPVDAYRHLYRTSWQDKRAAREEAQSRFVQWRQRKHERSKQRDASVTRDLAHRARAAWNLACSEDPGFEDRVETALLAAVVRGTEVRRAHRLIDAIAEAHAAEAIRRRSIYYGYNREQRAGMPSEAIWPVNRLRHCLRDAWEDAWQDGWWGDIGDDELPDVLGEEYERIKQLGERERMSRFLAS